MASECEAGKEGRRFRPRSPRGAFPTRARSYYNLMDFVPNGVRVRRVSAYLSVIAPMGKFYGP